MNKGPGKRALALVYRKRASRGFTVGRDYMDGCEESTWSRVAAGDQMDGRRFVPRHRVTYSGCKISPHGETDPVHVLASTGVVPTCENAFLPFFAGLDGMCKKLFSTISHDSIHQSYA